MGTEARALYRVPDMYIDGSSDLSRSLHTYAHACCTQALSAEARRRVEERRRRAVERSKRNEARAERRRRRALKVRVRLEPVIMGVISHS